MATKTLNEVITHKGLVLNYYKEILKKYYIDPDSYSNYKIETDSEGKQHLYLIYKVDDRDYSVLVTSDKNAIDAYTKYVRYVFVVKTRTRD